MFDKKAKDLGVDGQPMIKPRVLLVDDSATLRTSLSHILEQSGFAVVRAGSVKEALRLIVSEAFDVLLSDLHMPDAGDGLTVVSAMRHTQPEVATLLLSGYPLMQEAATAIVMQADEIMVKPVAPVILVETIRARLKHEATPPRVVETVASVVSAGTPSAIKEWLLRVELERNIITVRLDRDARTAHLPELFADLVTRLRNPLPLGTHALVSIAAAQHGHLRRQQGYSAAMIVEESRMLQVSIFQTLQDNLHKLDFSLLLVGVMAIADEVDSQLSQTMASFAQT